MKFEIYFKSKEKEIVEIDYNAAIQYAIENKARSVYCCDIPGMDGCIWTMDNSHLLTEKERKLMRREAEINDNKFFNFLTSLN